MVFVPDVENPWIGRGIIAQNVLKKLENITEEIGFFMRKIICAWNAER